VSGVPATSPAIVSKTPPAGLMRRVVNPVVRQLLLRAARRRTGRLMVLEVIGRRSGRQLRIPVLGHDVDGRVHVFTDASWAANFRGRRRCVVVVRGRRRPATGEVLPDTEAAAALRGVIARGHERMLGLRVAAGADPTDEELNGARTAIRVVFLDGEP
jgi:hypothetical protein